MPVPHKNFWPTEQLILESGDWVRISCDERVECQCYEQPHSLYHYDYKLVLLTHSKCY